MAEGHKKELDHKVTTSKPNNNYDSNPTFRCIVVDGVDWNGSEYLGAYNLVIGATWGFHYPKKW